MKIKNLCKQGAIILALLFNAEGASAIPIVDLIGDKDCFGAGGACSEGVALPGSFGSIVTGAGDPAFTDRGINTSTTTSWIHSFLPGAFTSATLAFRTLGIADVTGPYTVFVDGTAVGVMPLDGFGHALVETFSFLVPLGLVADGSATVSFTSSSADGWAIDSSELTLNTAANLSEPATLALLGLSLAGLGFSRKKKAH